MNKNEILDWLKTGEQQKLKQLFQAAYEEKCRQVGKTVYLRGIIEVSNICRKNCFYCGIRNENKDVQRYQLSEEEVLESAKTAMELGYGSVVIQAGERQDAAFIDYINRIIKEIKNLSQSKLGITLSLGEQAADTYRRWFDSGAHRYLLRIETSSRKLYQKMHPQDHDFETRLRCLDTLKDIGFQVGTGVLIGLPGQRMEDLCHDILFFEHIDADMIGMGPYIVHGKTPLAKSVGLSSAESNLELGLKMIALTRLHLRDVNIASTTALQTLSPTGRELGIKAGANIIMPNLTPLKYRKDYLLYENKPCLDENARMCGSCLEQRIKSIGETIGYHEWGDSKHFAKRRQMK
ncbi:MAG: [FeFe] hydrogenase H-cluster radical SAM maturase HydE [Candidatus Omnitrophota bacterium]